MRKNPGNFEAHILRVCLVWRRTKLILIELSLRELILIKSELDVNCFMFGYINVKVILTS